MSDIYACTALIGGASGALDSIDGDLLSDLDAAMVTTGDKTYHYTLDADNAGSDDGLNIIAPDTNPGDKRWVLVNVQGGGLTYEVITGDTNAQIGRGYLLNPSAALTLTLPSSPSEGDTVAVVDAYNMATTYLLTIARNSSYIEGAAEDLILDVDGAGLTLVYADATRGWEIVSEIGAGTTATFDYSNFVNRGDPAAWDWTVGDLTTDGTYHDLDCSGIVPSNAVAIVFFIQVEDGTAEIPFRLRKNGNSNGYNVGEVRTIVTDVTSSATLIVPCDANQVVEYYGYNTTWSTINIVIVGWFTDDQVTLTTGDGVTSGFKNKVINGNFDIWQRGTSGFIDHAEYSADRWQSAKSVSTFEVSQGTFTIGQTDVPNNPTYYASNDVTEAAGASYYVVFAHKIEDVRTFAGNNATLSFYAKADSALDMSVEFLQNFGSGGSANVDTIEVSKFSLTTSWQKFTLTVSIPSISGKTVGTGSYLQIRFWLDAGSNFDSRTDSLGHQTGVFDISQVQLEEGAVPSSFESRHIEQELALCQRYYETTMRNADPTDTDGDENYRASGSHTSGTIKSHRFRVRKRTDPTMTMYSITGASGYVRDLNGGGVNIAASSNFVSEDGFHTYQSSGTIDDQDFVRWHWTADAEL